MRRLGIPYYLTACNKRCSIKDLSIEQRNVSVSAIARSNIFGFKGTCLDYRPVISRKKKNGFPTHMDVFNLRNYLWEKHKHSRNFRDERLRNYQKLNNISVSQQAIARKQEVQLVVNYLSNL